MNSIIYFFVAHSVQVCNMCTTSYTGCPRETRILSNCADTSTRQIASEIWPRSFSMDGVVGGVHT